MLKIRFLIIQLQTSNYGDCDKKQKKKFNQNEHLL